MKKNMVLIWVGAVLFFIGIGCYFSLVGQQLDLSFTRAVGFSAVPTVLFISSIPLSVYGIFLVLLGVYKIKAEKREVSAEGSLGQKDGSGAAR